MSLKSNKNDNNNNKLDQELQTIGLYSYGIHILSFGNRKPKALGRGGEKVQFSSVQSLSDV